MLNVVALRGQLSRPATVRSLPSGSTLVSLDLTVRREGAEKAESVPVVWHEPPTWAGTLVMGAEVVVVGHVARRFFRALGGTQSRTEVVASAIVPVRSGRKVELALREVASLVEDALPVRKARLGAR